MDKEKKNQKVKQIKRRLLILPMILCLSSCTVEKNIELENGEYIGINAYQNGALNSLGGPDFDFSINNYHIYINGTLSGKLENVRMKDKYFCSEHIYWCFNDYTKDISKEIMNVKKAMKAEVDGTSSFPLIEGTYYLVEVNGDLFLLQGKTSHRIYALIKE